MPDAEKATVPVKFMAVSVTVTEPEELLLTLSVAALKLVATDPMARGSVVVWPGKAVATALDVPMSESEYVPFASVEAV